MKVCPDDFSPVGLKLAGNKKKNGTKAAAGVALGVVAGDAVAKVVKDLMFGTPDYKPLYGDISGVLPQPEAPLAKLCIVEARGGSDKKADGHRGDTITICNGVIKAGCACEPIFYSDATYGLFKKYVSACDGVIVRVNPGTYDGITQSKLDALMREMSSKGKVIMSHPDVMLKMGAKDALCKINSLSCGLPDTLAYYSEEELTAGFKKTCAFQPRVIKQNRGSQVCIATTLEL